MQPRHIDSLIAITPRHAYKHQRSMIQTLFPFETFARVLLYKSYALLQFVYYKQIDGARIVSLYRTNAPVYCYRNV